METLIKVLGVVAVFLIVVAALGALMAFPTMWLWNWLMPAIFGLKTITLWQAWGVNALTGSLFKSYNLNNDKKAE